MKTSSLILCAAMAQSAFGFDPIVGGEPVEPQAYPFMASVTSLYYDNKYNHLCGATLIAKNAVLTAAHCVRAGGAPSSYIRLGGHNLAAESEASRVSMPIKRIFAHPGYTYGIPHVPTNHDNDIAVIILQRDVEGDLFEPIKLDFKDPVDGDKYVVTGWGNTLSSDVNGKEALREVEVPVVSQDVCNSETGWNGRVLESMFCAGEAGKDACSLDSGGPLFAKNSDGTFTQYGIVSWGSYSCGESEKFGVYTRISQYEEWITAILSEYPEGSSVSPACECVGGKHPGNACAQWGNEDTFCFVKNGPECPSARFSKVHQSWYVTGCRQEEWFGSYEELARSDVDDVPFVEEPNNTGPIIGMAIGTATFLIGLVGFVVVLRTKEEIDDFDAFKLKNAHA